MTKKKKIILIFVITAFVIGMGVLAGLYVSSINKNKNKNYNNPIATQTIAKKEKTLETFSDLEKEIAGIDTSDSKEKGIEEESYSELYKEYLKLPEEEKEKSEVIPREREIPFEKLEEIKENLEEDFEKKEKQDEEQKQQSDEDQDDREQQPDEDQDDREQQPGEDQDDREQQPDEDQDDREQQPDEDKIPARFNLADVIDIKVENQLSYGLCWDFASMKALETHLALNNLGNYDFSELHVDYITSGLMYGFRVIHQGGNFDEFKKYNIESGVVLEKDVPYTHEERNIMNGKEFIYFKENDFTEEEYMRFPDIEKVIDVTETVDFPSLYKDKDFNYTDEQIEEFRETVKKHIMVNGGLYTCIVSTIENNAYVDAENTTQWPDHAVTIVGWDDNYSRDNFLSSDGKKPKKDGAYIALNSWGEEHHNKGYYYISYEDKYVENQLSGIRSTSMDSTYKIDSIKNPAIKEYLKNQLGHMLIEYEGEEYITKNALSNVYSLDLSNKNMTSLEGIEMFNNLYSVDLSNNNIKDITPITKITTLQSIDLSNNSISDISAFANMKTKSLYSINLSNNKIKDVSVLKDMKNEYGVTFNLDISGNLNVTGYDKLNNIGGLNISNCDIKDVSNLKNCEELVSLKVADTKGITGLEELSEKIDSLDISNCELNILPKLSTKINTLNISNNNLTTLDGIQNFENLYELDVSGNPIEDWSALGELKSEQYIPIMEDEEFDEMEYYGVDFDERCIYITAENCDIEDITVFNDLNTRAELYLKNNKIKDVSQFNNDKVLLIDLSNNEDITGLQGLSNIQTIFLNNCNISDIDEILKLKNTRALSLENNNLSDITKISELDKLVSLSLSGNKNLKGTISSENIYILNVSDCNLDNSFDVYRMPNLSTLNISRNNIDDVAELLKRINKDYMLIIVDEIDYEELEKIKLYDDNNYWYVESEIVNFKYNLPENESIIDLNNYKLLRRSLMQNFVGNQIKIDNGKLRKNAHTIDIDDITKNSIELKFDGWNSGFGNAVVKIIFNQDNDEEDMIEDNSTNTIENNTIYENTIYENTTTFEQNVYNMINETQNNVVINVPNEINNDIDINSQNVLVNIIPIM